MKLEEAPDGERIFVDANIFIYHFSRLSAECRSFLRSYQEWKKRYAELSANHK